MTLLLYVIHESQDLKVKLELLSSLASIEDWLWGLDYLLHSPPHCAVAHAMGSESQTRMIQFFHDY